MREIVNKLTECRQEIEEIDEKVNGYKAEYYYERLKDVLKQAEREAIGVWHCINEK